MKEKIKLIKEIYSLNEEDLIERKKALQKISPYINEIMDAFYEKLLQKPNIAEFIPIERIDELKKKQIKFLQDLLTLPFDENLYKRIAKVAIAHYHIKLDPISMSYGYHVLSDLILAQSQKDPSLLASLKLIIKYLKVSEAIMSEEYFAQKTLAQSPYRANDLFGAINILHMAYVRCQSSFENMKVNKKAKEIFEKSLQELQLYREVLEEAGFNLSAIKRFCTQFANDPTSQNLINLKKSIEHPLANLRVTSYLSLNSALALMQTMTDIIYRRSIIKGNKLDIQTIKKTIANLLTHNFGWAIERFEFFDEEPQEEFDLLKFLSYKEYLFYVAIDCSDVANKLYVLESIDLILEAIKLTLYLRSKEDQ